MHRKTGITNNHYKSKSENLGLSAVYAYFILSFFLCHSVNFRGKLIYSIRFVFPLQGDVGDLSPNSNVPLVADLNVTIQMRVTMMAGIDKTNKNPVILSKKSCRKRLSSCLGNSTT